MYNNYPFQNYYPNMYNMVKPKKILSQVPKMSWSGFLNNAERTLNVINQAMPIYKEVKPMIKNVGTIFKVINGLNTTTASNAISTAASTITNGPTFFA